MYVCDDGHEEICYNTSQCPLCNALSRCEELSAENNELENFNAKQQDAIYDLEEEVKSLRREKE